MKFFSAAASVICCKIANVNFNYSKLKQNRFQAYMRVLYAIMPRPIFYSHLHYFTLRC